MLHEIYPSVIKNQYKANVQAHYSDFAFSFQKNGVLLKGENIDFELPRFQDIGIDPAMSNYKFMFSYNGVNCFLCESHDDLSKGKLQYIPISRFRSFSKDLRWLCSLGYDLYRWYSENKFCSNCSFKLSHHKNERALLCERCEKIVYPKISAAVLVAVTSGDKILLVRGANSSVAWYSIVAGFVEIGESIEDAAIREVKEETGINIESLQFYKSQPWPTTSSLMLGFFAEVKYPQEIQIEASELSCAGWFSRENLPEFSPTLGLAGEMIQMFKDGGSV